MLVSKNLGHTFTFINLKTKKIALLSRVQYFITIIIPYILKQKQNINT